MDQGYDDDHYRLQLFPKKVWAFIYETASHTTYVRYTLTTCSFLDPKSIFEDTFLANTRTVFQRCRERNVNPQRLKTDYQVRYDTFRRTRY